MSYNFWWRLQDFREKVYGSIDTKIEEIGEGR